MTYNHIRFSPMKKLIRVSSHGRGIWQASLNCDYSSSPIIILSDTTWSTDQEIYSDVVIENGASLTITSVVSFSEQARILVKQGGLLFLDSGTLNNLCYGMWQGVEVWGDPTQASAAPYQGMVFLKNGAVIENAVTGILAAKTMNNETKGSWINTDLAGGIIRSVSGNLRNNKTGVHMLKYPADEFTHLSTSYFTNCNFIVDTMYLDNYDTTCLAKLSQINNVKFNHCTFINNSFWNQYGTGIYSFNSKFFVEGQKLGDDWNNGLFKNLDYGIYAIASGTQYYADIRHTDFNLNHRGVYLGAMSNPRITSNDFIVTDSAAFGSYGLYLDNSTGYMVEENRFLGKDNEPDGKPPAPECIGIGMIINNSGDPQNEIYNNRFDSLEIASSAQNWNRSIFEELGLKIKCNDYWKNSNDILVITEIINQNPPGISISQGAPGATDMQAGNTFSWYNFGSGPQYSDYDNLQNSPLIYYHHDTLATPFIHIKPKYRSPAPIITTQNISNPYLKEESCPSSITGGGGSIGVIKGKITAYENKADSTTTILNALVDGGNSDVLEQQVLQSMPPETYNLYMSLMGKSPYLSDSVLMAAIEKENVLPNVLIKDILVANPQAAKSEEVMQKVDEKSYPLSDEMLAEVLLGKYTVAAREKLEAQVNWYRHSRVMALNRLKQYYLSDTICETSIDSLIILLESETGVQEKYELLFAYTHNGQWTDAISLLNSIPSNNALNEQQQTLYNDFLDYVVVLNELYEADTNFYGLTEQQKNLLMDLTENASNSVGAYARNILISLGKYNYDEPILLPEEGLKSSSAIQITEPVLKSYPKIKVYPNPAKDYVIIEILKGNIKGADIYLYDNLGKFIRNFSIPPREQFVILQLKGIEPGTYIISVQYDGSVIGSEKLNLVK